MHKQSEIPVKKVLSTLLKVWSRYKWNGWEKGAEWRGPYARSMCRGAFVAFSTHIDGMTVVIKEHDYHHHFEEGVGVKTHHDVFRRREIIDPATDVTWVELEVFDQCHRVGRNSMFGLLEFPPRLAEDYSLAKKLFEEIKAVSPIHRRSDDETLSRPRGAIAFCNAVEAIV